MPKIVIKSILKNFVNLSGTRFDNKYIIFESDDWGSIRMPSLTTYKELEKKGLDLSSGDARTYNQNDTLATAEDLSALFDVLSSYKDNCGNHPVFTALSLTSNPDFEKIKESGFTTYFSEPFIVTLDRYRQYDAFKLWKQGMETEVFQPQFHGREHLNVATWMRDLQAGDKQALLGFERGVWGFNNKNSAGVSYQAAFDLERKEDLIVHESAISEGLNLFEQLHGYRASFFVPPNGPFNNTLERTAAIHGIKYMSASKLQREPQGAGKTKLRLHYLGQKNKWGQRYITRNAFFEPSQKGKDWVDSCLHDIEVAFRWKKPAVISTHRVNYVGSLNPANRDFGLSQLKSLLKQILIKWPEVQFITSDELGKMMDSK